MSLLRPDFDALARDDLVELVQAGATEGLTLDFKQATYGNSDSDKRELLKDVCAFANVNGGHIVLGLSEVAGVASALIGIALADADAEVLRLDQIIRTGIEPRVPGCRVKAVPLDPGLYAIVIRIGRSWRLPHRVSAQHVNKFWIRNSGGCHEASMDELRTMFALADTTAARARAFRDERLAMIRSNTGSRPLVGSGRLVMHLIPYSAFHGSDLLDSEALFAQYGMFSPFASSGSSPRYNFDGVINERGGELNHGYTQIFRNGIVEATIGSIVRQRDGGVGIPAVAIEKYFFERFGSYVDGLKRLGIEPPLLVMITLDGVQGAHYHVSSTPFVEELIPIDRDHLQLPECVLMEYGPPESYHVAIRPAFDALWNAVGFSASQFFNADGLWVGPKR